MSTEPVEPSVPAQPSQPVSGLNWGALAITAPWLIRNGFWVSFLVYLVLLFHAWPLSLLVSVLFFLRGTQWSWGGGRRWKSHDDFVESQRIWGAFGKVAVAVNVVVFGWLFYLWISRFGT
jgi:hypothetical protein